jgi:hypothetical protein
MFAVVLLNRFGVTTPVRPVLFLMLAGCALVLILQRPLTQPHHAYSLCAPLTAPRLINYLTYVVGIALVAYTYEGAVFQHLPLTDWTIPLGLTLLLLAEGGAPGGAYRYLTRRVSPRHPQP